MPSLWHIKKVRNRYYLYHGDEYIGPIDKIVEAWKEKMAPGAGFEPARGFPPPA